MFNGTPAFHVFAVLLNSDSGMGFLIGIGILVALLLLSIPLSRRAKKRAHTAKLNQIAQQLGWTFHESAPLTSIPARERFSLFTQKGATGNSIRNVMSAKVHDAEALAFEYAYSVLTASAEGTTQTTTKTQTVAYFASPQLNLPEFVLRPKGVTHKLAAALGHSDIAFDSHPLFSKKFLLRAPEEHAVRRVFRPAALAFFENNPNLWAEGNGNELLVYRLSQTVKPEELHDFLDRAQSLLNVFQQAESAPSDAGRPDELLHAAAGA
jgi:hypothetical protein